MYRFPPDFLLLLIILAPFVLSSGLTLHTKNPLIVVYSDGSDCLILSDDWSVSWEHCVFILDR